MLKRILAIGAALAVLLTVSACRSSKSVEDGSSSGYTGSDYTYDGSSGSSEQQSGDSSTTSGSSNGGQTGTSSKPTASIPSKTGGNAVMVDPGFLDGIDPFKDPVFKEQVTNLKGKTIKIGTFWPNNYKSSNSDPVAQANVKAIAAIKKDYNCEIKMVYMDSNSFLSDVASSTASGNIYADIYEIQGEMADLYKNGYFADLSKVKSVGLNTNGWSQASIVNATYKNVCYGVGLEKYIGYSVVYFNKALASKYKVGDLYSLVNKGEWTWSKFRSISESVYKQSNGKVYGCNATFTPYLFNLVFANGTSPVVLADGIPVFNGLDSKLLEALNWLQSYCKAGLYNKNKSGDYVTAINSFMAGENFFYIGGNGSPDINDLSALMEDDYGIIPFPKGDGQKDYTCILMNNRFYGLASNNSQVEDAGKVLVALGNRTFTKAANWDGEHASYVRDKESLEMLRKIRSYSSVFRVTTTSFEKYAADACVDQKMTPKQAMESIINSAQAEINERFGV